MKQFFIVILLITLQSSTFKAQSQTANEKLVKSTWTAMQTKYAPLAKKGEISVFDINGKTTLWPIWVRDISDEYLFQEQEIDLIWVDNMKYHYNQPYWKSMQNLFRLASSYPKTRITNFEDAPIMAEEKELFTKAVIARFGTTNNIYAITNEQQSPVEFMTAFFYVKGGVAKFIGYFAHPFVQ